MEISPHFFAATGWGAPVYHTKIDTISGGNGTIVGSSDFSQTVNVGIDPAALREIIATLLPEVSQFGDAEPLARAALGNWRRNQMDHSRTADGSAEHSVSFSTSPSRPACQYWWPT